VRLDFNKLRPNQKIRHINGTAYLIVRVVPAEEGTKFNKVLARWRNGPVGRFGKEVVRITPAHVRGFRPYTARRIEYVPVARRAGPDEQAQVDPGSARTE
jgi:hypothetical protein